MRSPGHGPNIGHGYVKYVLIDRDGVELPPVVFPALIARADPAIAGALRQVRSVVLDGVAYWTGEDALYAPAPLTSLAQQRLSDPVYIPVLLAGALDRLGYLNGAAGGVCVSGLPATWATDPAKAQLLGARIRAATTMFGAGAIRIIPEPLGGVYAALLDTHGQVVGDSALATGTVGVVDLGHLTVDVALIRKLAPVPSSLDTWQLGTAQPLKAIRGLLSAHFERELTLHETDAAVRAQALVVGGQQRALPAHWDQPLMMNGQAIMARLVEVWGSGAQLDTIVLLGGGAEVAPLVDAIRQRFPHAQVLAQPQTAIARGYARLARRLGAL